MTRLTTGRRALAVLCIAMLTPGLAAAAAPILHRAAPDFTRTDFAGAKLRLGAYRGKVVLLNFWATWCAPCLEEIPRFSAWQKRYGPNGLQVLGVSMDDDAAAVKRFLQRHEVPYPVVLGDERLGLLFGGVMGLPQSFLIDPQGIIIAHYEGEPRFSRMESQIKALLPRRGD